MRRLKNAWRPSFAAWFTALSSLQHPRIILFGRDFSPTLDLLLVGSPIRHNRQAFPLLTIPTYAAGFRVGRKMNRFEILTRTDGPLQVLHETAAKLLTWFRRSYAPNTRKILSISTRLRSFVRSFGLQRLANVSDPTSTDFHPCEGGGNETVNAIFSGGGATCDDQFLRLFEEPEVLLTAKNGSYLIMVSSPRTIASSGASEVLFLPFVGVAGPRKS